MFIHNISSKNDHETTDREIVRYTQTGPFLNYNYHSLLAIQEFLKFCSMQCVAVFSITCALNTAEYRLTFAFVCVFSCLFTALSSHWKSELIYNMKEFSSILKRTDSPAFRTRVCPLVLNYICSKQIWCKSNYSSIVINRSIFAHMVNCKNGYYFILAGADGWLPGNIYCILIIV